MDLVLYIELIALWWSGWVIGWLMHRKYSPDDSYWDRVSEVINQDVKEDDKEWGLCADCEVVGALERLEEQNSELMKENAELAGRSKGVF